MKFSVVRTWAVSFKVQAALLSECLQVNTLINEYIWKVLAYLHNVYNSFHMLFIYNNIKLTKNAKIQTIPIYCTLGFLEYICNGLSRCMLQWCHRQVVILIRQIHYLGGLNMGVCNKQVKERKFRRATNFPEAKCSLGSSFMVKIFHAVNIILTDASHRTVNSRPRMKGSPLPFQKLKTDWFYPTK